MQIEAVQWRTADNVMQSLATAFFAENVTFAPSARLNGHTGRHEYKVRKEISVKF